LNVCQQFYSLGRTGAILINKERTRNRTDAGNGEFFAAHYRDWVRYDHLRARWLIWEDKRGRWIVDGERRVRRKAKDAARERGKRAFEIEVKDGDQEAEKERAAEIKWSLDSESKVRIDAALSLAQSEPPLSDSGTCWDNDPWSFGVENGILDLKTGKVRKGKREDRITKFSPVLFNSNAQCPRFELFLQEIFNRDDALVGFVRRAIGYSLTGSVKEQCLFLAYGEGANGKSTLLSLLQRILGNYAVNLPASTFEAQVRTALSPELEMLCGSRFAMAIETREGMRLNEQRIKALTGGDSITARPLYRPPVTFDPSHKLWLAFNHKPVIGDDSYGMWRRVHLIPFTQKFDNDSGKDDNLLDALWAEAPGILAWAVRGCLEWQEQGLGTPAAVEKATAEYREESDHLAQFIEECCVVEEGSKSPCASIWESYVAWADQNEETPLTRPVFAERMKRRKFEKGVSGHGNVRVWKGLRLAAECERASACERAIT
jgi:putative DNA primase/helicase